MNEVSLHSIRPYARLLTMLGDQLIRNEQVALIELVKNSYDADSPWVKISFNNFQEELVDDKSTGTYKKTSESSIEIEDAGCGMDEKVISNHWLNPATPEKTNRKRAGNALTAKGRILQGEKGIGRFAMLKLGRKFTVITRPENSPVEFVIDYDFTKYDEEFVSESEPSRNLMLDELEVQVTRRTPEYFIERSMPWGVMLSFAPAHGTLIRISDVKDTWSNKKIEDVCNDLSYLQSIFDVMHEPEEWKQTEFIRELPYKQDDFEIKFYLNGKAKSGTDDKKEELRGLLQNNSVFRIQHGRFDAETMEYTFNSNATPMRVNLMDDVFRGYTIFRQHFGDKAEVLKERKLECGSFDFEFYIFDLSLKQQEKNGLAPAEKKLIKSHRVYLYRDGIRVYPYGEAKDDWLRIDALRGTVSAGMFLSNDQLVGCVKISQKENKKLRDKTNREGLIEDGNAASDFIAVLQVFLTYIRQEIYGKQYRDQKKSANRLDIVQEDLVSKSFATLESAIGNNSAAKKAYKQTLRLYKNENAYLQQRAKTTEDLAGVGLSVETASHDIMVSMDKVVRNLNALIDDISTGLKIDNSSLLHELESIKGSLSFVESQLKDIQILFKSSKQRTRWISVKDIIDKVAYIYRRILKNEKINFDLHESGPPLKAKTTDAVLLQLLLNLFDNAVYWLKNIDTDNKQIAILLDGTSEKMIFSDTGPGVRPDDASYIFEPFFSGKGEEGRGLGLYIARQLLQRHDYSIALASNSEEQRLTGANFVISFAADEEEA
jgi:signal transduction histidine kinase